MAHEEAVPARPPRRRALYVTGWKRKTVDEEVPALTTA
jgi:hypothetical protein